jgi:hypothetical protein
VSIPPVPANVAPFIQQAAQGTGLPESVVAAQNYTESAYGANQGPSTAGAEGPWQFLVSTFQSIMGTSAGITSWATSTQAYIKYMNQLLKEENGNVRNALAAYNAGPGNIQAGYGYADAILADAGQSQSISIGPNAATGSGNTDSLIPGFSWPSDITGFFKDAKTFTDALLWIVNPASWLRIGAFGIAIVLLIGAIAIFAHADEKISSMPMPIPVPI